MSDLTTTEELMREAKRRVAESFALSSAARDAEMAAASIGRIANAARDAARRAAEAVADSVAARKTPEWKAAYEEAWK